MNAQRLFAHLVGTAATVLLVTLAKNAYADPDAGESFEIFTYEDSPGKRYGRASLEELGILTIGLIQYFDNVDANSRDWDLDYSWGSFRRKLVGDAIKFDTNHFETNWMTHTASGWLYYVAARGNRLSIAESAAFAVASSTIWEYLGEFREQVSVNDMISTPGAGVAVGESLTQLGAYFERHGRGPWATGLSWLFGTSKRAHDWLDKADIVQSPERGWHEFRLSAEATAAFSSLTPDETFLDTRLAASSRILHAPQVFAAGDHARWLTDGNWSYVSLDATMSRGELVDGNLSTYVSPAGYFVHHARIIDDGQLRGHTAFVGYTIGFDYAHHIYERTLRNPAADKLAQVQLVGTTLDHWMHLGWARVHGTWEVGGTFAGVSSPVVETYMAMHRSGGLPTVLQTEDYAHAWGFRFAPALKLHVGPWSAHAWAEAASYTGLTLLDRRGSLGDALRVRETRVLGGTRLAYRLPWEIMELGTSARGRWRTGQIAEVTRTMSEIEVGGDVSFLF